MAGTRLIESVPNFSEGRDERVIARLSAVIRQTPGVSLLDYGCDADHNRSVFTFIGAPEAVAAAAMSAAEVAVAEIDLSRHRGVHPRIGALDVAPFVPLGKAEMAEAEMPETEMAQAEMAQAEMAQAEMAQAEMADCVALAREFGATLWERLRVPVFLYEHAAIRPEHRGLEEVRRRARAGEPPDIGEGRHPTAGACAVGARDFLVAWNIWLETADLELARRLARAVRFSSGGFPGVKALGLPLASKGMVQVSINTTNFRATPLAVVFRKVKAMAAEAGVRVKGSELIGMIPRAALQGSAGHDLAWLNLSHSRVLG